MTNLKAPIKQVNLFDGGFSLLMTFLGRLCWLES